MQLIIENESYEQLYHEVKRKDAELKASSSVGGGLPKDGRIAALQTRRNFARKKDVKLRVKGARAQKKVILALLLLGLVIAPLQTLVDVIDNQFLKKFLNRSRNLH